MNTQTSRPALPPRIHRRGQTRRLGYSRAWSGRSFAPAEEIIASEPIDELRGCVAGGNGIAVTAGERRGRGKAREILIGVKPGVVLPVIQETAAALKDKLVISLAAGIRLASMEATARRDSCAR